MYILLHAGNAHPCGLAIGARPQVPVRPRAHILHGHEGAAQDGLRVHDAVQVRVAAHDAVRMRVGDHDAVRVRGADHDAVRVADHDAVRGADHDVNARHLLRK